MISSRFETLNGARQRRQKAENAPKGSERANSRSAQSTVGPPFLLPLRLHSSGRKEGSGETRRFVFIKCSTTSSSSALKISQLVVTGRVGAGGKALARFAYHRIVHVTPNSIFNTLPESAMDGRTKTGEEGGAPRRSSEPSPCRSATLFGAKFANCVKRTEPHSLPPSACLSLSLSPFDARQFARDRRETRRWRKEKRSKRAGKKECVAVPTIHDLCFRSFSPLAPHSLFFSPVAALPNFDFDLTAPSFSLPPSICVDPRPRDFLRG